jgi:hypothetical protein
MKQPLAEGVTVARDAIPVTLNGTLSCRSDAAV